MAYDRYDGDRERGWRSSDRDRDYDRNRERGHGRGEDRGWFERAGEEISSWFGGDERDRDRHERERMNRGGDDWSSWSGGDRDREFGRDRDRGYGRQRSERGGDDERGYRPMNWTSSNEDYRSGSQRGYRGHEERGYRGEQQREGSRSGWGGEDRGWGNRYSDQRGDTTDYSGSGFSNYGERDRDRDLDREGGGYRPIAGRYAASGEEYGRGYDRSDSEWGRDDYRRTSYAGSGSDEDRHYRSWRDRQAQELDRDYQDYCRERDERFESDFGEWRQQRQQQRQRLSQIREHMDVVGNDGERVGKVDRVTGDKIVLTKNDSEDGHHHSITCSMIDTVEDNQVRLNVSASQAKDRWRDEDRERALFEREDQGRGGPHNLERSFSGTYR